MLSIFSGKWGIALPHMCIISSWNFSSCQTIVHFHPVHLLLQISSNHSYGSPTLSLQPGYYNLKMQCCPVILSYNVQLDVLQAPASVPRRTSWFLDCTAFVCLSSLKGTIHTHSALSPLTEPWNIIVILQEWEKPR